MYHVSAQGVDERMINVHYDVVWNWTETHQQAFDRLKDDLTNPPVLKFFDAGKPVDSVVR